VRGGFSIYISIFHKEDGQFNILLHFIFKFILTINSFVKPGMFFDLAQRQSLLGVFTSHPKEKTLKASAKNLRIFLAMGLPEFTVTIEH